MALSRHARKRLAKARLLEREPDPQAPGHESATPRVHTVAIEAHLVEGTDRISHRLVYVSAQTGDGWRHANDLHVATGAIAHYRTGEIAQLFEAERRR